MSNLPQHRSRLTFSPPPLLVAQQTFGITGTMKLTYLRPPEGEFVFYILCSAQIERSEPQDPVITQQALAVLSLNVAMLFAPFTANLLNLIL